MLLLYRALLATLPGWFREEFGREMLVVFRDSLADARREGAGAVLHLSLQTTHEVIALALRLHLDALRQDVTYAARTLLRQPTFTLAMVATLAVSLGPTLVVVNLLHQVVLAPLPFPASDRLVSIWLARPEANQRELSHSLPDFVDYRRAQRGMRAVAAHAGTSVALIAGGEPRQIDGVLASADLFAVLQVAPVLGRPLTEADSAPGAAAVAVLGDRLWRQQFEGRRDVVGQTVRIDGVVTEIVGVLPPFDFPVGSTELWLPLRIDPEDASRGNRYLRMTGRLGDGVSQSQATDMFNGIAAGLAAQHPSTNAGARLYMVPLKQQLNGDAPQILVILAVAVAAVLLIGCTNVASLLTVRASLRNTEIALRTAVGASVRRIRRQLLVEHLLVAAASALVAVLLAVPLHQGLVEHRLLGLPRRTPADIGWPAFAVLSLLVLLVGAVMARIAARGPAIAASAATLLGHARQTGSRGQLRLRRGLVMLEVAGALVLVVGAGLMLRSAARLSTVDPGFRTERVVTFGVVLPPADYREPAQRLQFVDRVLEQIRTIPGVEAAASGSYTPMGEMRATRRFARADRPPPPAGAETVAIDMPVGPGYFEVMGIPLLQGRTFEARDHADSPPVLVVSEAFAREYFPDESPVGKSIRFFSSRPNAAAPPSREIVGVVGDVHQDGVSRTPVAHMYVPYAQSAWIFTSFFARVTGDPEGLAPLLQRAVSAVDPTRPVRDVKTTGEIVAASLARQRAMTTMLTVLAGLALLLATIGLYGVSATSAAARARELAIRAAIGADPATLLRLVLSQGLVTAAAGVGFGAGVALLATRSLGALLYQTAPTDPATFSATAVLLLVVGVLATYLPARRTLRANPAEVLRAE